MIKSIIYLDESKLFSISSQMFEGITEYLLKEVATTTGSEKEQKGPLASGRVLADTMRLSERSVEKRFLYDHSLSIFENRLNELGLVEVIESGSLEAISGSKSFISVKAKASFIDAAKIVSLLGYFNRLGQALAHITNFPAIAAAKAQIEKARESLKDKHKLAELKQAEKKLSDVAAVAKQSGLFQDPKFLEDLAVVTQFGFAGQLEVQQRVGESLFSACLKRDCLREPEDLMIRKLSRNTEKEVVVLGVITQSESSPSKANNIALTKDLSMKEAVTQLVNQIAVIEGTISGKGSKEVVIDPIAIYVTL